MEISFSKEDLNIQPLYNYKATSIHDKGEEKVRGNNTITAGVDIIPHEEEYGAIAPKRGIVVPLQGVPKKLTCGDPGTIH